MHTHPDITYRLYDVYTIRGPHCIQVRTPTELSSGPSDTTFMRNHAAQVPLCSFSLANANAAVKILINGCECAFILRTAEDPNAHLL